MSYVHKKETCDHRPYFQQPGHLPRILFLKSEIITTLMEIIILITIDGQVNVKR